MFGRTKVNSTIATSVVTPTSELLEIDDDTITDEYMTLCTKLKITNIPAVIARLGLRVYNEREVNTYLAHKFEETKSSVFLWVWRPVREQDKWETHHYSFLHRYGKETYSKPIPFPVLKTMESITEILPKARFFISDEAYASDFPDPFLKVTLDDPEKGFIIERWDEPSFR